MIHFFSTSSNDATNTPFGQSLRELGIPHRIFSGKVQLRYKHRLWLLIVGLPQLAFVALRNTWRSLVESTEEPDTIVVGSHIEAFTLVVMRWILHRRPAVVLIGFIFTERGSRVLNALRTTYFRWLFDHLAVVICHSSLETERYRSIFGPVRASFVYVPYGLHIGGHESIAPPGDVSLLPALSAGRSGRDYRLLFQVFARRGWPLRVVCDSESALSGCGSAPNITVLRSCYDAEYARELKGAGVVVVPLSVVDISAGQMVLIQAMAYRKPLVVTRTPTIEDYLEDERNALLVPAGDATALDLAIERLRRDPALARQLSEAAYATFLEQFSMKAFVARVSAAISAATR